MRHFFFVYKFLSLSPSANVKASRYENLHVIHSSKWNIFSLRLFDYVDDQTQSNMKDSSV